MRQQKQQRLVSTALALGAAAMAVAFGVRSFIPSAGNARGSLTDNVGGRRQLLSGTMTASVALGAALANQDRAAADEPEGIGRITQINRGCFETGKAGKVAAVSGENVLVWDPTSGECPEGQAFVHAVGRGDFIPMTSSKGPATHTIYAAAFPETTAKAGQCITPPKGWELQQYISWEIASKERGAKCDAKSLPSAVPSR